MLPIDKTPPLKIDLDNIAKLQADAQRLRELRDARTRLRASNDNVTINYIYREYGSNERDSFDLPRHRIEGAIDQEIQSLEQQLLAYGVDTK